MAYLPKPRHLLLLAMTLGASPISATPTMFARQSKDTCAAKKLSSCPDTLPDSFCCPSKQECIALADNTSALCCPAGTDCDFIQTITCDIDQQNADDFPNAPVKTTVFDVDLKICAGRCCPFGYSCSDNDLCVKDKDQTIPPGGKKSSTTSTTAEPTSTTAPASTQTSTTEPTSTSAPSGTPADGSDSDSKDSNKSSPATTSIIGGVVGGCLVLLLIAVIIFLYIRRNNRRHAPNEKSGGQDPTPRSHTFGTIISDPIIQPNSYRTDFILKTPSVHSVSNVNHNLPVAGSSGLNMRSNSTDPRPSSTGGLRPHPRTSIFNPFISPNPSARSPTPSSSSSHEDEEPHTGHVRVAGTRLAPIRAMKASSRHLRKTDKATAREQQQQQREPSSENINVFADPSTVGSPPGNNSRYTAVTTFSDMMDVAELGDEHRGKPFVPTGTTPKL